MPFRMPSHRSPSRSGRSWKHSLRSLLPPPWLSKFLRAVNRFFHRLERRSIGFLYPGWLRRTTRTVQTGLHKAESKVARAGHAVTESVAKSAVGSSAKQLARSGRRAEGFAVKYTIEMATALVAAVVPQPVRRLCTAVGRVVWRIFGVFFIFLGGWIRTRHYGHLLAGAPAFLLALPLVLCMIRMPFSTAAAKAKHYRAAAQEALLNKRYETASLYYRKLHQLGAMNEVVEFQAAFNEYESGDKSLAIAKMQKLAPTVEPGFPPAHLWLARLYLNRQIDLEQEQLSRLAEIHLSHALDRDPGNPEARALRALHFQQAGRWEDALNELRQVVKQLPNQGLNLAQLYARQGRWEAARREVEKVLRLYDEKAQSDVNLAPTEYLIWANANLIIGRRDKAEQVLEKGLEDHAGDEGLVNRLHQFCIRSAAMLESQRADTTRQVRYLKRAWELRQDNQDPLVRLATLAQVDGEPGQIARRTVAEMLESQPPPANLHAIMGAISAEHHDLHAAASYLRTAVQLEPADAQSLNNLAWVLLQLGDQHASDALSFSDRALAIKPQEPMYRETRGQLLLKLGRHREAIKDLQYALNGLGNVPEIHLALATAYEQLGELESARAHRIRAVAENNL